MQFWYAGILTFALHDIPSAPTPRLIKQLQDYHDQCYCPALGSVLFSCTNMCNCGNVEKTAMANSILLAVVQSIA